MEYMDTANLWIEKTLYIMFMADTSRSIWHQINDSIQSNDAVVPMILMLGGHLIIVISSRTNMGSIDWWLIVTLWCTLVHYKVGTYQ